MQKFVTAYWFFYYNGSFNIQCLYHIHYYNRFFQDNLLQCQIFKTIFKEIKRAVQPSKKSISTIPSQS